MKYYAFKKLATKSKLRFDCVASTGDYEPLESKRATKAQRETPCRNATDIGQLIIYYGARPDSYGGTHPVDRSISIKGQNLSSVYMDDPTSGLGYGDMKGTHDALLFRVKGQPVDNVMPNDSLLEVFIFEGAAIDRKVLFADFNTGKLDEAIKEAMQRAHKEASPLE